MENRLMGNFESKIDEKNRIVVPAALRKNLLTNDELFLILAKSEQYGNYIKIIDEKIFSQNINPLTCDSLQVINNLFFKTKLNVNHRIQLNTQELERLMGQKPEYKAEKLTFIWVGNHIAITKKKIEEILT